MYRKSSPESPNSPDELGEFDIYGKTPPRTKILRKNREKRQREKTIGSVVSPRTPKKAPLNRRNTVCAVYDDLIQKFETKTDLDTASTKKSKRQLKLLRGSERDLKLDLAPPKNHPESGQSIDSQLTQSQPSWHIGNHKRFMCLSWRTTACPKFKHSTRNEGTPGKFIHEQNEVTDHSNGTAEEINNRVEFYESLACLVKSGSIKEKQNLCPADMFKRNISHAECRWQNELNDLIWLELQAFHANKSCTEADEYLCTKRGTVGILLNEIMSYQFQRHPSTLLTQNSDSGVEEDCEGCLSIHCSACLEAQNEALKEIEDISRRLDAAEALFPSSKAFGEVYPLYNSPEFTSRVKAISLWYNMTKIQRLKLNILGRFLHFLHLHQSQWPSGGAGSGSPSDSNNSSASSANDYPNDAKTDSYFDYFNIAPLQALTKKDGVSPYRLYIENILKTRALNKSLNFLEMLHTNVLKKARITLEKPEDMSIFDKQICETEEEELMRFGAWSPEAKALNLPSYRTTFLFLGSVPLEVIHEFLRLRLEQKPENPSLLSIRQLMRELKEGLTTATKQRSRIDKYIKSACKGLNECSITYQKKLKEFDNCLKYVFKDYLDYLENWALLNHASFQKNLLEAEWAFSTSVVTFIPDGRQLLQHKFCSILASIFKSIGERFIDNIDILIGSIPNCSNVPHDEELKHNLFAICRELQTVFTEEREMSIKTVSFCKKIKNESLHCYSNQMLKESVVAFKCIIPKAIAKVQKIFDHECFKSLDETEKKSFESRIREILMQGYKFGFEFYQEMTDVEPNARREKLIKSMVQFATLWMRFAVERCDRGRGMRPRWAYQGLDFLLTVCEPKNTRFLSEEEFNDLKMNMEMCIKHVIGTSAPSTPDSGFFSISPRSSITKSRGTSPSPRPTYKSQRSSASHSRKTSSDKTASPMEQVDTPFFDHTTRNGSRGGSLSDVTSVLRQTHLERTREAIDTLENDLNLKLRKQRLIGKVIECEGGACKSTFRQRHVNFTWQRGIKIGQGRFGKVYTAVNNATGEMMAVKEIALQHNDNLTIKRVAEEMKILEGIVHENLVKYYGVEVHRDEMLLFMEYCAEGTLENLVAGTESGLPELLIRRFTYQLVSGVACMHSHGIVHRDIKTANIFLTDEGNCLKIGDFGCAAKIKFHSTMLGELKGFVGTQAYMAPEVFTKNMAEGHGRAADIWSVGCVVVEMSSGKRPWAQFDSNYQIMFKVGMGQSPDPPDDMIDEGLDFLELCFRFDPKERATAHELLDHNFVKAGDIVD